MAADQYYPFVDAESLRRFESLIADLARKRGFAVLGAGASIPLGYPTWSKLTHALEAEATKLGYPGPRNGDVLDVRLQKVLDEVGEETMLAWLRSQFPPKGRAPRLYHLISTIDRFAAMHTYNYDDCLGVVAQARGREIDRYPAFAQADFTQNPYLYLHGHLAPARSINELVLGRNSYIDAYSEASGLRRVLGLLYFTQPVLFVGLSLSDEFANIFLQQMHKWGLKALPDGSETIQKPGRWYALLPDPGQENERRREDRYFASIGLTLIWYVRPSDDVQHAALEDALALLMARTSETSANAEGDPNLAVLITEALRLASIPTPRPLELERAEWVLRHPRALKTFVENCRSPGWFDWLADRGSLSPIDSRELEDGTLYAVPWPQADYLRLMAQKIPDAVGIFLSALTTDNWIALRQLPSILRELPAGQFWQLSNQFEKWMATRGFHLDGLLEVIFERLDTDRDAGQGISLLPAIAAAMSEANPRNELPKVRDLATAVFVGASQVDAAHVVALLMKELADESLSKWEDPEGDISHIVRKDIERPNRESRIEYLDWLASTMVAVLEAGRGTEGHNEAVGQLLQSRWSLPRRAAIYELSQDSNARVSLGSVLSDELEDFMFGNSMLRETALFITSLDSGDPLRELAQRFVDTTDDKHLAERWQPILDGEGDPLGLDFHEYGETEVFRSEAPLTSAELASRFPDATDRELIDIVASPAKAGIEVTWRHWAELLWDSLASIAVEQERPGIVAELTTEMVEQQPGTARLIRKAPDLLAKARPEDWAVVAAKLVELGKSSAAQWAVLDALRELVSIAPESEIERIREFALGIVARGCTPLDEPLDYGNIRRSEPPDILVRQLNEIPGKACELLFSVFVRERQTSDVTSEIPGWLRSFVEQPSDVDGVEIRVLVGEVFPFLVASDPEFARRSVPRLLPRAGTESDSLVRQAFWSGYGYKARPHSPTLELLAQELLSDIPLVTSFAHIDRQIRNALVEHAIVGWANDVPGYESLTRVALHASSQEVRQHFLWAVGRFAANDKERPGLWQSKIKVIVDVDQAPLTTGATRSRDGYGSWLQFIPELLLDSDLPRVLEHVVSQLTVDSAYQFFNFIGTNRDHNSQRMFGLFEDFALRNIDAPQMGWYRDQFAAALKALGPAAPLAQLTNVVNKALGKSLLTDEETRELLRIG